MADEKRHPIRVVARRTGLTPEVLRIWEKRYNLVEPGRTRTGRRIYSDGDIERLLLVHRATLSGRRVGEIFRLSTASLQALAREDERAIHDAPRSPAGRRLRGNAPAVEGPSPVPGIDPQAVSLLLEECMEAVRALDASRLEGVLNRSLMTAGWTPFIEQIVGPLLQLVGHQWEEGRLDPRYEHLATGTIRRTISRMPLWPAADPSAPVAVVTTPAGQRHEMGAMLAAAVAHDAGWWVIYLGADLSAFDIACAAEQGKADLVALSIVYPADDPSLRAELLELRRRLPKGVAVIVGGAAAPSYAAILRRVRAEVVPDMRRFRSALDRIRGERAAGSRPKQA